MRTLLAIKPAAWTKAMIHAILLVGIYYNTYTWLITKDWSRGDYSYCILVPVIVLYLIWEKRFEIAKLESVPSWKGFGVLCTGVILFWLGELSGEFFSLYVSSWLVLVGLCWIYFGWKMIKAISFPLVFTLAMFPLPHFLNNKVTVYLKLVSSWLGVAMMQALGMTAYREGNIIDLGFTQLQVVDACSGLRYLFPLIVLGILLAYFFRAAFWKKALLVISTVPISIIVNSLRIASVGILYQFWGPKVAEGFFHDFSGWFIFMLTLGVLLFEMWVLKGIGAKWSNGGLVDPSTQSTSQPVNQSTGLKALFNPPQFVVAVILLSATLALSRGVEFREIIPINKSFDQFPIKVGEWTGKRQSMEQRFIDRLDLSEYVIIDYKNRLGKNVNFYVAYYESQRKGESIHSPATCLPGSGWIYRKAGSITIPVATKSKSSMPVNRAFMQKNDFKQLSYYWFPMRGRVLTSAYQLKFYTFWDALTRQRTDGALVRLITPVYESESLEKADERLQAFTRQIVPVLSEFIPD